MAPCRSRFGCFILLAVIASGATAAFGRIVLAAYDVSAAEAITVVEAWIKAHPKEAAGYSALAHLHALAWAYGETIPVVGTPGRDALAAFTEDSTVLVSRTGPREILWMSKTVPAGARPERPVTPGEARHLAAAIAAYRKAIELDANDALSELGLGWMLVQQGMYARQLPADYFGEAAPTAAEQAAWAQTVAQLADGSYLVREAASKTLLAAMPRCMRVLRSIKTEEPEAEARIQAVAQGYFELQALDHYRKAYTLRAQVDLKNEPTYQVDSQVSAKAGAQILAVLGHHPEAARKGEAKAVQEVLEPLAKKWQELMMRPQ